MNRETERLGKHLQAQIEEHDRQLFIYEALAAHDLYARLRRAGLSRVSVMKHDDGAYWVERADGKSDGPVIDQAAEIHSQWLDEYGHGAMDRLHAAYGDHLDVTTPPYMDDMDERELIRQRDHILTDLYMPGDDIELERDAETVAAWVLEELNRRFPDTPITEVTDADETRFGIGEELPNGKAPLVVRLDHSERTIEAWNGAQPDTAGANTVSHAYVQWRIDKHPTEDMLNAIDQIVRDHGHLVTGTEQAPEAHPYFQDKAAQMIQKAGGDPTRAAELAAWAQQAKETDRPRTDGVLVAEDGSLVAETFRNQGKVQASYVEPADMDRLGLNRPNELGLAQGAIEQKIGQRTIHVSVSDVAYGPSEKKMSPDYEQHAALNPPAMPGTTAGPGIH